MKEMLNLDIFNNIKLKSYQRSIFNAIDSIFVSIESVQEPEMLP